MPVLQLKNFNNRVDKGVFPDDWKLADVTLTHKKEDKSDKTNYLYGYFQIFKKYMKN